MTPDVFKQIFANNIKKYRKINHLTQMGLAEKANLSVGYLCDLEAGNKWGTPETITKLASALNINPSFLFLSDTTNQDKNISDDLFELSTEIKNYLENRINELQKKYL